MFDRQIIALIDKPRKLLARLAKKVNLKPDHISISAVIASLITGIAIMTGNNIAAIVFLLLSRLFDGLDGALAKLSPPSKHGGYVDVVCDLFFYSFIVLSFGLSSSDKLLPSFLLLFSFYLATGAFLGLAASAVKGHLKQDAIFSYKGIYYDLALIEGTETNFFFLLLLLFPQYFSEIAYIFAALCVVSFFARVYSGIRKLRS